MTRRRRRCPPTWWCWQPPNGGEVVMCASRAADGFLRCAGTPTNCERWGTARQVTAPMWKRELAGPTIAVTNSLSTSLVACVPAGARRQLARLSLTALMSPDSGPAVERTEPPRGSPTSGKQTDDRRESRARIDGDPTTQPARDDFVMTSPPVRWSMASRRRPPPPRRRPPVRRRRDRPTSLPARGEAAASCRPPRRPAEPKPLSGSAHPDRS